MPSSPSPTGVTAPPPTDPGRDRTLAGIGAATLATVLWGSAGVLGKSVSAPAVVMLVWRQLLAVVLLVGVVLVRRHPLRREHVRASVPAMAMFGLHLVLFFGSLQLTSVSIVVLIYALAPVLVLPVAWVWLGERPPLVAAVLAVAAIGGIALVVGSGEGHGTNPTLGVVISVVNVCWWVAFTFASKRARTAGVPTLTWLLCGNCGSLVFVVALALVGRQDLTAVAAGDWWRIAALAVFPGLLGHGLMTWSYQHLDVSLAAVIAVGEPVLSTIGAAVFLGEALGAAQWLGVVVVAAAVAGVVLLGSRRPVLDVVDVV